jgi:hypothetical protein
MIAHVAGLPLEEIVPALSGSAALVFVRAWLALRLRGRAGA